MSWKKKLKYFARSRSLGFLRAMDCQAAVAENQIAYRGKPVYYRAGTSDPHLIYSILLKKGKKAEYAFAHKFRPEVILDIGVNIGISTTFLAEAFPDAVIYAIEPVPDNLAILRRNAEARPAIHPYQVALADRDGEMEMMVSRSEREASS